MSNTDGFTGEGSRRPPTPSTDLASLVRPMTLHIMPQSHIDLIWYWLPAETVRMVLTTFRGHVEALEADPARSYAQSQASAYDVVRREDPALFARVATLVADGRWEVVGGEWSEADPALPGPEARLRQFFYGQRFFHEHFNKIATVGWSPDGFTMHPGSLPQLLLQAGMNAFVHKRPREIYGHVPLLPYRWRGFDGSEVLAYRSNNKGHGLPVLSDGQRKSLGCSETTSDLEIYADSFARAGLSQLWGPMGVGDVGGVNSYDAPELGDKIDVRYSTPSRFFQAVREERDIQTLRRLQGSLPRVCMGALTTWHSVKQLNRQIENALVQTETLMGILSHHGLTTAIKALDPLWQELLFYQFHDALAGCGTDPVREHLEANLKVLLEHTITLREQQIRRLAETMPTPKPDRVPILVCNSLGWTRSELVAARVNLPSALLVALPKNLDAAGNHAVDCRAAAADAPALAIIRSDGTETPVFIKRYARLQSLHVVDIEFEADRVPGFGYRCCQLGLASKPTPAVERTATTASTGALTATFDPERGGITSIDLETVRFAAPLQPLGSLILTETGDYPIDYGVELRAWNTGFTGRQKQLRPTACEQKDYSGGRRSICCSYQFGRSQVEQEFVFTPHARHIDVCLRGDWQEVENYLHIQFSFAPEKQAHCFADLAYGWTEALPTGDEHPMQYVCGMRDQNKALAIVNGSRYGCRWHDGVLSVAAIRCASYPAPISDRGRFCVNYRLAPMAIDSMAWPAAPLRAGYEFNQRLISYAPERCQGALPAVGSFWHDEPEAVLPTLMKPAHDGDGLIIRTVNPGGKVADRLSVKGAELVELAGFLELPDATEDPIRCWRPWEIKTLRCR